MKQLALVILVSTIVSCTPGGQSASLSGSTVAAVTIDANLTNHQPGSITAGSAGGYAPLSTTVAVGTTVRFTNSDGFAHTATSIGASTFPSGFPFTSAALTQSGSLLSAGFSSGDLQAGGSSRAFTADKAGTYLFGCFHHYGAPMRGAIVVR